MAGDVPLTGNMSPGGKASLILYRNGTWYLDTNCNGIWCVSTKRDGNADVVFNYGISTDLAVAGMFQ